MGPEGVSIAQYAAVKAALAERFLLDEALATYGIASDAWAEADFAWTARLVGESEQLGAYKAELALAQDRLSRKVVPLDDDLAGWVGFLHAYTTCADPLAMLQGAGLGMNDVARLTRRWARRLEQDKALAERAAKLTTEPGAVPKITVEPAVLPRGADPASEAALDAALERDQRALRAHAAAQLAFVNAVPSPASPPSAPEAAPPPRPVASVVSPPAPAQAAATVDLDALFESGPALPFTTKPPEPAAGATQDVSAFAESMPALPFAPAEVAPAPAPPSAPASAARRTGAIAGGRTADLSALMESVAMAGEAAVLPFSEQPERAGAGQTQDVSDFVEGGAVLPFSPAAPALAQGAPVELTMEQYASLCVELSLDPAEVVLARFRIDAAGRAALDALWRRRLAERAEARAAFESACGVYRAWLVAQRRAGGASGS